MQLPAIICPALCKVAVNPGKVAVQDEDVVRKAGFSWLGIDWGRRGGLQARELALWVQLQREFQRRSLLSSDAIKRLDTIGFTWKATVCLGVCA